MNLLGAPCVPDGQAFAETTPVPVPSLCEGHLRTLDKLGCCFFLALRGNVCPYNLCFGGFSFVLKVTVNKPGAFWCKSPVNISRPTYELFLTLKKKKLRCSHTIQFTHLKCAV